MLPPMHARAHGLNESETNALLTEIAANALWQDPPPEDSYQAPNPKNRH